MIVELSYDLFRLRGLETLNLSQNQITKLPATIGNLIELRELNLSDNLLSSLPELANLGYLLVPSLYFFCKRIV